jgi:hypothetical protein
MPAAGFSERLLCTSFRCGHGAVAPARSSVCPWICPWADRVTIPTCSSGVTTSGPRSGRCSPRHAPQRAARSLCAARPESVRPRCSRTHSTGPRTCTCSAPGESNQSRSFPSPRSISSCDLPRSPREAAGAASDRAPWRARPAGGRCRGIVPRVRGLSVTSLGLGGAASGAVSYGRRALAGFSLSRRASVRRAPPRCRGDRDAVRPREVRVLGSVAARANHAAQTCHQMGRRLAMTRTASPSQRRTTRGRVAEGRYSFSGPVFDAGWDEVRMRVRRRGGAGRTWPPSCEHERLCVSSLSRLRGGAGKTLPRLNCLSSPGRASGSRPSTGHAL